jgi:alanyl-tRNA synthetase
MTSRQIRQQFLDFFASKGHLIVPSAPLVAKNDPTLMFNNSGMAQFKDFFLGNGTPPSKRIADTQKCLRVSGKHNDLEDLILIITPCLRCWATGLLVIISKKRLWRGRGSF